MTVAGGQGQNRLTSFALRAHCVRLCRYVARLYCRHADFESGKGLFKAFVIKRIPGRPLQ